MTVIQTNAPATQRHHPLAALLSPLRPILPKRRDGRILAVTLTLLAVWGMAIATLGVPALVWPMMLIVPAMVAGLVVLTQGM